MNSPKLPKFILRRLGYPTNSKQFLIRTLFPGKTLIGRNGKASMDSDHKLEIVSKYCSRNHCYIVVDPSGEKLQLQDFSMNGTYVNGALINKTTIDLKYGDIIIIGYKQDQGIPVDESHYSFKIEYVCDIEIKKDPDVISCDESDITDVPNVPSPIVIDEESDQKIKDVHEIMISLKIRLYDVKEITETCTIQLKNELVKTITKVLKEPKKIKKNKKHIERKMAVKSTHEKRANSRKCVEGCKCREHSQFEKNKKKRTLKMKTKKPKAMSNIGLQKHLLLQPTQNSED